MVLHIVAIWLQKKEEKICTEEEEEDVVPEEVEEEEEDLVEDAMRDLLPKLSVSINISKESSQFARFASLIVIIML